VEQGLILGRYRPLAELGEGGHGAVDLAFDTKMARRVAIKRIPLSHAGVRRLGQTTGLAEARTSALLNHPNVVTVHEWDTDDDEAFLIMEHVDGAPLSELLATYAPLEPDEAAAVLAPVCAALAFAHDNGVLHLDLKPENVLVTRDGLVKVADFGVASLTNAAGQAISAGGTLGYMPPEQLRGEKVDARSDVWALGALAYEALTGAVPFASDTIEGALYRAEHVEPPSPFDYAPSLPPEVDEALLAALAPVPGDRPRSVGEFAAALLPYLGDPVTGRDGLRELVDALNTEDEARDASARRAGVGLWDRLVPLEPALRRAVAALACGWLGWSGLAALDLGWPATLGGSLAAAAAAAFAPPAGLAAGLVLLAAGAFSHGPLVGMLALVAGALWWASIGRTRGWAGFLPLLSPLLAAAGLAPALPMLAGFFMPGSWLAVAAGACSGLVAWLAATTGGSAFPSLRVPLSWLAAPLSAAAPIAGGWGALAAALAVVAGWALAAGAMALAVRRATRPAAFGGALAGSLVTLAALGPWMTGGSRLDPQAALQVGLSLILVCVVIALGPPFAAEDDG
jgi:hypothetical protein